MVQALQAVKRGSRATAGGRWQERSQGAQAHSLRDEVAVRRYRRQLRALQPFRKFEEPEDGALLSVAEKEDAAV